MRLVGESTQLNPAGAEKPRVAVPLPVAETVIVEVPVPPGKIWAGETAPAVIEVMVNPGIPVTEIVTIRVRVPLVPVTVTLKLVAVVQPAVKVDVLGVGSVTLVGDSVAVHPAGTVEVTERLMLPVKPLTALAVIVDVPVLGAVYVIPPLDARLKSVTWKRIDAVVCDSVPSVPVTVTV